MTSDPTSGKPLTAEERYTEAVTRAAGATYTTALTSYGVAVQEAAAAAYVQMIGDALSESIGQAYQQAVVEAYEEAFLAVAEALRRRSR